MRAYVFPDAALVKHAGRFVWLSIDTEKPSGATFLAKFPIESWPTLLILDPDTEKVAFQWAGSANVEQLGKLLDDGERAYLTGRKGATGPAGDDLAALLAEADQLTAAAHPAEAAKAYQRLLAQAPADWPRRPRAVESLITAQLFARDVEGCARTAKDLAGALPRGPSFANVVGAGLGCALEAPADAAWGKALVGPLEQSVREAVKLPDLLADDRSGLYQALVEAREAAGDPAGARKAAEQWWSFLEEVAGKATDPEARSAFDPHRVLAAGKMGDPARVLPALEATERDLPEDYNAPARKAAVLRDLGRYNEALSAVKRALSKAYGPRRLRILLTEASIRVAQKDLGGAAGVYQEALHDLGALPTSQVPHGLADEIKGRLAKLKAEKAGP